jgi:hypothetical protein
VRFTKQGSDYERNCNCPAAEGRSFCKHLIAVAIAVRDGAESGLAAKAGGVRPHDREAPVIDESRERSGLTQGGPGLIRRCAADHLHRGATVIGPESWREIELRYAYGALHSALPAMMDHGIIKPYPTELIARTLLAPLREASGEVGHSKYDPGIRAKVSDFVAGMLTV